MILLVDCSRFIPADPLATAPCAARPELQDAGNRATLRPYRNDPGLPATLQNVGGERPSTAT